MAKTHTYPKDRVHYVWAENLEPVLVIESGDTVVFNTREVTDNQFSKDSVTADIANLEWEKAYPLAGPIAIDGAEPGDILEVEIVDLQTGGWGWAAIFPEFGLLQEEFPDAYLRTFDLSDGKYIYFNDQIKIPSEPFLGTMGVSPKDAKDQPIMPPGVFGGNMDIRQLTTGTKLYLPVQVAGALFSCGDGHAVQGDGEVGGSGIECPMKATLKFRLIKGKSIPAPQYQTAGALKPRVKDKGFYGTTGVGPDLYKASQDAVRAMVDYLSETYNLDPKDAYVLSSLCVDLKISEIVDAGQYVVSAVVPLSIFAERP